MTLHKYHAHSYGIYWWQHCDVITNGYNFDYICVVKMQQRGLKSIRKTVGRFWLTLPRRKAVGTDKKGLSGLVIWLAIAYPSLLLLLVFKRNPN